MAKICFILILITCGILQLLRSLPRKDGAFFSCGRKKIEKIEHNKFAIYDRLVASTGSFNWTTPATRKNSENCLFVIHDKKAVAKYFERFEQLWSINTQQKSDNWFKKKI